LSTAHPIHWTTTKPAAFIKSVAAINPNVIVLLNVGSAIIVEDWMASAKAIIQTFYPGQEGGTALAALLFGDTNFSGKLPFTVGQNESDYPQFQNSGSAAATIDYYHGYRLFEKNAKPVRYWFGYGQSYTTYKYSNLQVLCSKVSAGGRLNVQVTVQNTGKVAGDEIVQLYIGYPNSKAPKRPVKELKAFTRVTLARWREPERPALRARKGHGLLGYHQQQVDCRVGGAHGSGWAERRSNSALVSNLHHPVEELDRCSRRR
jgi:beta-glucosidase